MAIPTSRDQLKQYCLRKCGAPVININIEENQLQDCIDDALQFWQDHNADATERTYLVVQLTQEMMDNQYIPLPDNIFSVQKVFPINASGFSSGDYLFNLEYHIRAQDVYQMAQSPNLSSFFVTRQYIAEIDNMFNFAPQFTFNIHTNRVYLQTDWGRYTVGSYILIECYAILDMDSYSKLWGSVSLRELAAAMVKKQWGSNLSKFDQIRLPGGVTLNGWQIVQQAEMEIEKIKQDYIVKYSEPLGFIVG